MAPHPAWTASRFAKRIFGHVDCGHRHIASENMPNRNVEGRSSSHPAPGRGSRALPMPASFHLSALSGGGVTRASLHTGGAAIKCAALPITGNALNVGRAGGVDRHGVRRHWCPRGRTNFQVASACASHQRLLWHRHLALSGRPSACSLPRAVRGALGQGRDRDRSSARGLAPEARIADDSRVGEPPPPRTGGQLAESARRGSPRTRRATTVG